MKGNCQTCLYRGYKVSQKPCISCKKFNKFVPALGEENQYKLDFFETAGVIIIACAICYIIYLVLSR